MNSHMAEQRLLLIVCLSLLLLTLPACGWEVLDTFFPPPQEIQDKEDAARDYLTKTAESAKVAATATWSEREPTLIAEVATHEAKATGTAKAEEAAAGMDEQAAEEPAPIEGCSAPGAWCVVEGRLDLGPGYPEDRFERNEVNISFPVDGGEVSRDFHMVFRDEAMYHGEVECVELHEHTGVLSGHYDPASRQLEGVVHGYSWSWKVLEGCEYIETVDTGDHATSWRATYNPTTGELQGDVTWETEDGKMPVPFHGIAQSE